MIFKRKKSWEYTENNFHKVFYKGENINVHFLHKQSQKSTQIKQWEIQELGSGP